MIKGCKSVICIDLKGDFNTKTHKNPRLKPTIGARTAKCRLWHTQRVPSLNFFQQNLRYIILGCRFGWVDLGTQIGRMAHLKKWSFFHRTPYCFRRWCGLCFCGLLAAMVMTCCSSKVYFSRHSTQQKDYFKEEACTMFPKRRVTHLGVHRSQKK